MVDRKVNTRKLRNSGETDQNTDPNKNNRKERKYIQTKDLLCMDIKKNNVSGIVHALEIPILHHSYSSQNMNPYHLSHRPQKGQPIKIQIFYVFPYPVLLHSTEEQYHQFGTSLMMSFTKKVFGQ